MPAYERRAVSQAYSPPSHADAKNSVVSECGAKSERPTTLIPCWKKSGFQMMRRLIAMVVVVLSARDEINAGATAWRRAPRERHQPDNCTERLRALVEFRAANSWRFRCTNGAFFSAHCEISLMGLRSECPVLVNLYSTRGGTSG